MENLARINRNFGGHSVLRTMLARVARKEDAFTLLDIGAGSGDAAKIIQDLYPLATVTSLDYRQLHLENAPHPKLVADAFQLPFLPRSFDYVSCSLFLHHFADGQVVDFLRSFYGAAREALLVSDLERHVLPYWFLPATKLLFGWQRMTLHDGPTSVRASFRPDELLELAGRAGIRNAQVEAHRPAFRISLIAVKEETPGCNTGD
ncbi:MAG: methyltransferase domain-containing protein [Bryobacteraceae bacterium]